MKYRKLGKYGPTVSAIGLGAGSATTNFGERDDDVQIATVHRAMDLGVTLFDTADRYMGGRHERLLGRALKGRREKVIVCSKFGNIDKPDGTKAFGPFANHVIGLFHGEVALEILADDDGALQVAAAVEHRVVVIEGGLF